MEAYRSTAWLMRRRQMAAMGQSVPSPLFSLRSAFGCIADGRGDAAAPFIEYTP